MCWTAGHRLGWIAEWVGVEALSREGLTRRRNADRSGMLSDASLLCTFWYIDALASVARRDSVSLLSEDIDPQTDELWSNFPRTDSRVRPMLSASSRSWEEGPWHAS
jgi:hypothetical protein